MTALIERGAEQLRLKTPSIQQVVTPDRLLLFLKALPKQPGAKIEPTKFVLGGKPYMARSYVPGLRKGGLPKVYERSDIVPLGKIAIEIEYPTNLNLFWAEVRELEKKQKSAPRSGKAMPLSFGR